jgi:hypothetical protein
LVILDPPCFIGFDHILSEINTVASGRKTNKRAWFADASLTGFSTNQARKSKPLTLADRRSEQLPIDDPILQI